MRLIYLLVPEYLSSELCIVTQFRNICSVGIQLDLRI